MGTFVGRDEQRRLLAEAAEAAMAGRGGVVLVVGEAGIGKTALVDHVVRSLPGVHVAWGGGRATERLAPLRAWRDVLRSLVRAAGVDVEAVVERVPALAALLSSRAAADAERVDLHDAVADLLQDIAAGSPVVLVFDDLHWAGDDSIALLDDVASAIVRAPVLIIGTVRDEEQSDALRALRAQRIPLGGLAVDEAATLVDATADHAAALVARTGGNPLFLLEVHRLEAAGRPHELPTSVQAVLGARLGALGTEGREVLAAGAVLGEEFELAVAQEVAGIDDVRAVDAAVAHRLVVASPAAVLRHRFSHALVREAVLAPLRAAERASLEARAAAVLRRRGATAARIAAHLRAAALVDTTLLAAAAAASTDAAVEAEELLAWDGAAAERRWAVELADAAGAPASTRLELRLALADALDRCGRSEEARAVHLAAAAAAKASGDGFALARAALGLGGGIGGFEVPMGDADQVALLRDALALVTDDGLRAQLLARLSIALTFMAPIAERVALADEAMRHAEAAGDGIALASALAARCDALAGPEHVDDRIAMASRMHRSAEAADSVEHVLLALRFLVVAHMERGAIVHALDAIEAFERDARRLGQARHRWYVPLWRAALAGADGEAERARALNAEAARTGERGGSRNAWILATSQHFVQLIETDALDEAYESVRRVVEENPDIHGPDTGLAWVQALRGDVGPARAYLDRAVGADFAFVPRDAEWLAVVWILLETATIVGHRPALERLLQLVDHDLDRHAVDGIGASYLGVMRGVAAGALAALGRTSEAEASYRSAIAAQDAAGGRRRSAHLRLGLADVVRGRDPGLAAALLAEATALDPGATATYRLRRRSEPDSPGSETLLCREGDVWSVTHGGRVVRLRATRGIAMLAALVARPGAEVPALELDGGADASGGTGPAIDDTARAAYRRRVAELEDELDDADRCNDPVRSERARAELDALLGELSRAFGLGGRVRDDGAAERARMRVTKALKAVMDRLDDDLPDLAAHLRAGVRTGAFCSYAPDPSSPVRWRIEA